MATQKMVDGKTVYFCNTRQVEEVVVNSIQGSFPEQASAILEDLKWDGLMGCYFFNRWGMFVGVELDGYIHS